MVPNAVKPTIGPAVDWSLWIHGPEKAFPTLVDLSQVFCYSSRKLTDYHRGSWVFVVSSLEGKHISLLGPWLAPSRWSCYFFLKKQTNKKTSLVPGLCPWPPVSAWDLMQTLPCVTLPRQCPAFVPLELGTKWTFFVKVTWPQLFCYRNGKWSKHTNNLSPTETKWNRKEGWHYAWPVRPKKGITCVSTSVQTYWVKSSRCKQFLCFK